tara:strand:+ start:384 stop:938 length:555 start_codon:yes stop_codon:yes gene_type:complete
MSSNGARSGGGGSGVPDMIRPAKIRRREIIKEKISKTPVGSVLVSAGEAVGKFTREQNLKRRKEFIKSKGLTSEEINMSDSYLSSAAGLEELRKQGYRTVVDTSRDANNSSDPQYKQTTAARMTAPTTAEVSQSAATEAASPEEDILYRKRKTKRQGKSLTIQTSPTGVTAGLTLGKRSLLGTG